MTNEWTLKHTTLPDGGSMYAETNINNFIAEPWNALSSLVFLIPAIYWAMKIRNNFREHLFTFFCIPFLILGGIGSALFHAFRSSEMLLWMDILPILILTLSVGVHFWKKVIQCNWRTFFITAAVIVTKIMITKINYFPHHTASNISYLITGIFIFLPTIIILIRTGFYKFRSLLLAIVWLSLGLLFRETDTWGLPYFEMGTHFLWHIATAVGSYFLAGYIFYLSAGIEKPGEVGRPKTEVRSLEDRSQKLEDMSAGSGR